MELKSYHKIFIGGGVILLLGSLLFIAYRQNEIFDRQEAIEKQIIAQKQFSDEVLRSRSEWATAEDLENFAKDNKLNLKPIKDDLDKLHAEINSINYITVRSVGQIQTNVPSTSIGEENPHPENLPKCKDGSECPDPYGFNRNEQVLKLNEKFGANSIPFGEVTFSNWQKDPWGINISSREYRIGTVTGTDNNGKQIFYNKMTIKVKDKEYEVPIVQAETKTIYPQSKFNWWNPQLYGGISHGLNVNRIEVQTMPSINFGFLTYGKPKDNSWVFLTLGVGYALPRKRPQFIITPVQYNIGKFLPFVKNIYVAPDISMGGREDFAINLGLRVGL